MATNTRRATAEDTNRSTDTIHAAHREVVDGLEAGDRVELVLVDADDHDTTVRATVDEREGEYYVGLRDPAGNGVRVDELELHQSLGNKNKYVAASPTGAFGGMHAHRIRVLNGES